jgi:antitoxin component YwqK of YwqJK toxin-antitoxin module
MKTRIILAIFLLCCHFFSLAQNNSKYTPKRFVVEAADSTEFKATPMVANGLVRWYYTDPEMWITDVTDDNNSKIKGRVPALVCVEANYKNGKKNGTSRVYLIDSSNHSKRYLVHEQTFADNKLNGTAKTFYLNGNLYELQNFKNDSLHGISREYEADGKSFEEEIEYINGSATYNVRTFFKSGKLHRVAPYKNDHVNGVGLSYYENGKLEERMPFVNDVAQGLTQRYYETGILKEEMPFKNGTFHGIRKYYHPNGKLMSIEEYKDGKPWNALGGYTDKGVKRNQGTLKNGTGTLIYYDENGAVETTMHFVNGIQQ